MNDIRLGYERSVANRANRSNRASDTYRQRKWTNSLPQFLESFSTRW